MTITKTTKTFTVTLPCGRVETRKSSRDYKFAVIGYNTYQKRYDAFSFNGEYKHAEASARNQMAWGDTEVRIVSL